MNWVVGVTWIVREKSRRLEVVALKFEGTKLNGVPCPEILTRKESRPKATTISEKP